MVLIRELPKMDKLNVDMDGYAGLIYGEPYMSHLNQTNMKMSVSPLD